jgi:hypothetical protein
MTTFVAAALLALTLAVAMSHAHTCAHDRKRVDIHVAEHQFATASESAKRDVTLRGCDESASVCDVAPIRISFDTRYLATGRDGETLLDDEACARVGQRVEVDDVGSDGAKIALACTDDMIMTPQMRTRVLAALDGARRRIQEIFHVIPIERVVFPDNVRGWCAGSGIDMTSYTRSSTPVPEPADADLVIVVTARPTGKDVLAWATACIITQYGRPSMGHVNVGINEMSHADPSHIETVLVHEMLHVLGFSGVIVDGLFVKPETGTLINALEVASTSGGERSNGLFLTTPNVVRQVRDHFQCDSLKGGELEDTASHWEARIFPNEIMSPTISPIGAQPTISAMTLAYFEDMGSYRVDYSKVGEIPFGHNLGCAVPTEFCKDWPAPYDTCFRRAQDCSPDRRGYGACAILDYADANGNCPLKESWQEVFTDEGCVGGEEFTDFCSFPPPALLCSDEKAVAAVNAQDVSGRTAYAGMEGGANSRCFQSSVVSSGFRPTSSDIGVGCFGIQCTDGELRVKVGGKLFDCPSAGGPISIVVDKSVGAFSTGYNGTVVCPRANDVCCDCGQRGFCAEGKCVCDRGFSGEKCGTSVLAAKSLTLPNPAKWPSNPFPSPILTQSTRARNDATTATVAACAVAVAIVFAL